MCGEKKMRLETVFNAVTIGMLSAAIVNQPWKMMAVVIGWGVVSAVTNIIDQWRYITTTTLKSHG